MELLKFQDIDKFKPVNFQNGALSRTYQINGNILAKERYFDL